MTYEEAETLLGQAVALNIIAETCLLYSYCKPCPYFNKVLDECILRCDVGHQSYHIKEMESQALSILNKERNDFNDTRGKN